MFVAPRFRVVFEGSCPSRGEGSNSLLVSLAREMLVHPAALCRRARFREKHFSLSVPSPSVVPSREA